MSDVDFRDSNVPEMTRYEHRRKNLGAKAVVNHGYDPTSDSYFPAGIVQNPDGTYSLKVSPGVNKIKVDKGTTNIVYVGIAARGSATSSSVWQITKIDKTVTNQVTITSTGTTAIWDNRATETYS